MASAVVILGAGSSADFGVPTLREVFKDSHARRYLTQEKPELLELLTETFWAPRGESLESSDQSLSVEEMLTALRDWEQEEELADAQRPPRLHVFRKDLYCLIERAVFAGKSSNSKHLNPLISLLNETFEHITWASFNWDCIFESSFWYASDLPWPHGHRQNPRLVIHLDDWRGGDARNMYLKLHGSINWWMIEDQLTYLSWGRHGPLQSQWAEYDAADQPQAYPVILEPSVYKYNTDQYRLLEPQWREFFRRLCEAQCVLVVGYSLPALDSQARSKILTAYQVNPDCHWAVVDPSDHICSNYSRLLGNSRLEVIPRGLAALNNGLRDTLDRAFPNVTFPES